MSENNHRGGEFNEVIIRWFSDNGRDFPWRKEENTAYEVLMAEILLRRTMAERVKGVFNELIAEFPTSNDLVKVNPKKLIKLISTLGLIDRYKTIIEAAKYLNDNQDCTFESLQSLNGVGDYIAGAFMIFYKGENHPIIDSNIRRIFKRYFEISNDKEISSYLIENFPKRIKKFYYGIIDFGALICKPKPNCNICPMSNSCKYFKSTYSL